MVSEIRVPSSSSSSSDERLNQPSGLDVSPHTMPSPRPPTNSNGLDLDALLDVGGGRVI